MIGIIVPAYNGERFLRATLESVCAQSYEDWRLIAIDDGSTDATPTIVNDYAGRDARIKLIRQSNGGVAAARNRGLRAVPAGASTICFLDHDDVLEPHALRMLQSTLDAHPNAPAAHGVAFYIDENGRRVRRGELEAGTRNRLAIEGAGIRNVGIYEPTNFACMAIFCNMTTPGQSLIRAEALDHIGPLDLAVAPADDWDMWLRITGRPEYACGVAFVDQEVLGFRMHGGNQSCNHANMAAAMLKVRRKHIESTTLTREQREMLRAGHSIAAREVARKRFRWAASSAARGHLLDAANHLRHAATQLSGSRMSVDGPRHPLAMSNR